MVIFTTVLVTLAVLMIIFASALFLAHRYAGKNGQKVRLNDLDLLSYRYLFNFPEAAQLRASTLDDSFIIKFDKPRVDRFLKVAIEIERGRIPKEKQHLLTEVLERCGAVLDGESDILLRATFPLETDIVERVLKRVFIDVVGSKPDAAIRIMHRMDQNGDVPENW